MGGDHLVEQRRAGLAHHQRPLGDQQLLEVAVGLDERVERRHLAGVHLGGAVPENLRADDRRRADRDRQRDQRAEGAGEALGEGPAGTVRASHPSHNRKGPDTLEIARLAPRISALTRRAGRPAGRRRAALAGRRPGRQDARRRPRRRATAASISGSSGWTPMSNGATPRPSAMARGDAEQDAEAGQAERLAQHQPAQPPRVGAQRRPDRQLAAARRDRQGDHRGQADDGQQRRHRANATKTRIRNRHGALSPSTTLRIVTASPTAPAGSTSLTAARIAADDAGHVAGGADHQGRGAVVALRDGSVEVQPHVVQAAESDVLHDADDRLPRALRRVLPRRCGRSARAGAGRSDPGRATAAAPPSR